MRGAVTTQPCLVEGQIISVIITTVWLWSYSVMGKMTVGIILTSLSKSVTGALMTTWAALCSVWMVLHVVISASPCLPGAMVLMSARMNLTRKTVLSALKILSPVPLVTGACLQPGFVTRPMTVMMVVMKLTVITRSLPMLPI